MVAREWSWLFRFQVGVAEADAVIFVTDIRSGVSGQDHDIARYLRLLDEDNVDVASPARSRQTFPRSSR